MQLRLREGLSPEPPPGAVGDAGKRRHQGKLLGRHAVGEGLKYCRALLFVCKALLLDPVLFEERFPQRWNVVDVKRVRHATRIVVVTDLKQQLVECAHYRHVELSNHVCRLGAVDHTDNLLAQLVCGRESGKWVDARSQSREQALMCLVLRNGVQRRHLAAPSRINLGELGSQPRAQHLVLERRLCRSGTRVQPRHKVVEVAAPQLSIDVAAEQKLGSDRCQAVRRGADFLLDPLSLELPPFGLLHFVLARLVLRQHLRCRHVEDLKELREEGHHAAELRWLHRDGDAHRPQRRRQLGHRRHVQRAEALRGQMLKHVLLWRSQLHSRAGRVGRSNGVRIALQ